MSIFLDAIKVLEERGWHQGSLGDPDGGPVCLIGALCVASGVNFYPSSQVMDSFDREVWTARCRIAKILVAEGAKWEDVDSDPAGFNDNPSTSYEDVVLLLKKADALA